MKTPRRKIERVAVVGAGTMGAQIAAHLAGANLRVLLLDLPGGPASDPAARNRPAAEGLERARRARPPAFHLPGFASRVRPGNLEDDAEGLAGADWILEAVVEDMAVKRQVLARIDACRRPGALVTTNTSGLSVASMAAGRSADLRAHFLGTHFFNPPRYMRLTELVPTPDTLPETLDFVRDFADRVLGKGVVVCRDTPGFIGNRIGIYAVMDAIRRGLAEGLSFEEVDALTGPAMGRPRSGTFRLCDLIGLDVLDFVAGHLWADLPENPDRETYSVPQALRSMRERGWLGDKRGQGFYRREGREILTLDPDRMEYRVRRKVDPPAEDLSALLDSDTPAGRFAWGHLSAVLAYAARIAPDIADDLARVDDAMRWGFHWTRGPFATWDALGVRRIAERLAREGKPLPDPVAALLGSGGVSFYTTDRGARMRFDPVLRAAVKVAPPPGVLALADLQDPGATLGTRREAALLDLGDGILCLSIPRPFDPFDPDGIATVPWALEAVRAFDGLVIAAPMGDFWPSDPPEGLDRLVAEPGGTKIEAAILRIQEATEGLRGAAVPVVAAISGRTAGFGLTLALAASGIQADVESAMGYEDVPGGRIPVGGGLAEIVRRVATGLPEGADPVPAIEARFQALVTGRFTGNALEARQAGLLRPGDGITMNPDRLLADAKAMALARSRAPASPDPPEDRIPAAGLPGLARLRLDLYLRREAAAIDEASAAAGLQLARILCGGEISGLQEVPRGYMLNLEREALLSLCRPG